MNIQEFFIKWNGKVCPTGSYPAECVNIIKEYMVNFLGLPEFKGNAIDYWNKTPQGFTKISKTIFNQPNPGDIVCFNYGTLGHIGICNWTTFFTLQCFEQNNPVDSPCHFQTHKNYKNILGWLRPLPVVTVPKIPLRVAFLGSNLPPEMSFQGSVAQYSSGKITTLISYYLTSIVSSVGMFTQQQAYDLMEKMGLKEKFVFIFYPPNSTSSFYATYFYPKRDCMITTCPGTDARSLAFEFSHQLQLFFNEHRGTNAPVQVVDANFPSDELIFSKFNSVSKFYS